MFYILHDAHNSWFSISFQMSYENTILWLLKFHRRTTRIAIFFNLLTRALQKACFILHNRLTVHCCLHSTICTRNCNVNFLFWFYLMLYSFCPLFSKKILGDFFSPFSLFSLSFDGSHFFWMFVLNEHQKPEKMAIILLVDRKKKWI